MRCFFADSKKMKQQCFFSKPSICIFSKKQILGLALAFCFPFTVLSARSYSQEAKYAFSLRKWDRAYELFEKAKERDPKSGNPHFYMGYIREEQNKKAESVIHYQKALELELDKELKGKTFWKICLYYKEIRDWENLKEYADKFYAFSPNRSVQKLQELAEKNYELNGGKALLRQAKEHEENGEYSDAAKLLEQILKSDPSRTDARWRFALLRMKEKEFLSALKHLQILVDNHPNSWEYQYKSGVCYYRLGQYEKALPYLKKTQSLYSGDNSSFSFYMDYMLGNIYLEKMNEKLALHHLHKAEKNRGLNVLYASLARTYWRMQNTEKAVIYADKASQKKPKQAAAYSIFALESWGKAKKKEAYKSGLQTVSLFEKLHSSSFKLSPGMNKLYNSSLLILANEAVEYEDWSKAVKLFKKIDENSVEKIRKDKAYKLLKTLSHGFEYNFAAALMYNKQPEEAFSYYQKLGEQDKAALLKKVQEDEVLQGLMEQNSKFKAFIESGPELQQSKPELPQKSDPEPQPNKPEPPQSKPELPQKSDPESQPNKPEPPQKSDTEVQQNKPEPQQSGP